MLTKSIIWDIDGTVIDTRNAMASAYRVACEEMGLKEDNYRRIFAYVGQKSSKVFVDQFGLTGAAYDEAIDRIGFERLGGLIEEGNPCEMTKVIRECLFK